MCTAYCTAEKYHIQHAAALLRAASYTLDPTNTGLTDQVIHLQHPIPGTAPGSTTGGTCNGTGDAFIFPSGNIVSWSLPSATVSALAKLVSPAAVTPFTADVETEDLEYTEDPRVRRSRVAGDIIILGTAPAAPSPAAVDGGAALTAAPAALATAATAPTAIAVTLAGTVTTAATTTSTTTTTTNSTAAITTTAPTTMAADELNITLAKIAFSSGLARSTKLAVLESLLNEYLETTSTIPLLLSRGSRLPFTRSFILCKTGQLLQFRAQLNLYSELTDSLPDLFWDSRHELGLEGYYDAVGRALDVDVRIRQLNEKLDYASGIVEVLRELLSERHSLRLEWIIIVLIAVEVGFELMRIWREHLRDGSDEERYRLWRERCQREGDDEWQAWKRAQAAELAAERERQRQRERDAVDL